MHGGGVSIVNPYAEMTANDPIQSAAYAELVA